MRPPVLGFFSSIMRRAKSEKEKRIPLKGVSVESLIKKAETAIEELDYEEAVSFYSQALEV